MLTRKRVLSIALKWSFLGYVDLSKRRVAEDDMKIADKKPKKFTILQAFLLITATWILMMST